MGQEIQAQAGEWRGMPFWDPAPKRQAAEPCPHCARPLATTYRRKLSNTMALKLIHVYQLERRHPGQRFFHVKEFDDIGGRGEFGTLSAFGVVEEAPRPKPGERPAGKTLGLWGITEFGRAFLQEQVRVPHYALVQVPRSRLVGFGGPMVGIREVLSKKNRFSYDELVSADTERYRQLTLDRMFKPKAV